MAKGGGVSTRRGGYGPGVAEGGLGRDALGPRGGKGYPAGRAGGCPRSAEGARFRLNIGETSVTSRRSFREDFVRSRPLLDYLAIASHSARSGGSQCRDLERETGELDRLPSLPIILPAPEFDGWPQLTKGLR